jgi:hypothetical protein
MGFGCCASKEARYERREALEAAHGMFISRLVLAFYTLPANLPGL